MRLKIKFKSCFSHLKKVKAYLHLTVVNFWQCQLKSETENEKEPGEYFPSAINNTYSEKTKRCGDSPSTDISSTDNSSTDNTSTFLLPEASLGLA